MLLATRLAQGIIDANSHLPEFDIVLNLDANLAMEVVETVAELGYAVEPAGYACQQMYRVRQIDSKRRARTANGGH